MTKELTIEHMATFCKQKGFVFQNSEIYGGLSGIFDYGPLGVELKNNIKNRWWKYHVHDRDDMTGIDGSIISREEVWKASGHVDSFGDLMLTCGKCKTKVRADHIIEEKTGLNVEGKPVKEIANTIKEHNIKCPKCSGEFQEPQQFNLLFPIQVGAKEEKSNTAYLRGETCQMIFTNFKNVLETGRMKLPFGIAQIGKAFRNEISPRDFLFRLREFDQMEIEYFINPNQTNNCPYIDEIKDHEILVYDEEMQNNNQPPTKINILEAQKKGSIKTPWHAYWLAKEHQWFIENGCNPDNFRIRQHVSHEKSHYALDTWDLEYKFPFGWKELQGMANRTDYDLKQHMNHSKKDLRVYDEEAKEKILPHVVAEPSQGVSRAFLVFMFEAYNNDEERGNIVLKLHNQLAPIKVAVLPLVNKLNDKAREIHNLIKTSFNTTYDKSGSVGRRYARADEIGIPYCITIDFDTLEDNMVTIRDRDTTNQKRIKIDELFMTLHNLIHGAEF